jgi:hypothetical protein
MSCAYTAPNGTQSRVFKSLYKSNGLATAVANLEWFKTQDFNNWYAGSERTVDGEPVISNGLITNEAGETRNILNRIDTPIKDKVIADQVNYLTKVFNDAGIQVNVTSDNYAADIGYVVGIDNKAEIVFNPFKVKEDSVFHEFGHIYVDLIGENDPFILQGIDQLKYTELWNIVAKRNPQLEGLRLGKEVLTTAIGMEAARINSKLTQAKHKGKNKFLDNIRGWLVWVGQLFRRIAAKFGIEVDVAKMLAYELTSGRLRSIINGRLSSYIQYAKADTSKMGQRDMYNYLNSLAGRFVLDESGEFYTDTTTGEKLRRTTSIIDEITYAFDREANIERMVNSDDPLNARYTTIEQVEKLWADKREEGTAIHAMINEYVNLRKMNVSRNRAIQMILTDVPKPPDTKFDKDNVRIYTGTDPVHVRTYILDVTEFIEKLIGEGQMLIPEFTIGSTTDGVAGTVDLIAIDVDGRVRIFDYKTKEFTTIENREYSQFDRFYAIPKSSDIQYLRPPFNGIQNTIANRYGLQLSYYAGILSQFGVKVDSLHIVPFVGEIIRTNTEEGDFQYNYQNVKRYTGGGTRNGIFTVKNYAKELMTADTMKTDFEDEAAEFDEAEYLQETLDAEYSKQADIDEWLKQTVLGLKASMIQLDQLADRYIATAYRHKVEKIIGELHAADEFKAIADYTKFVLDELHDIEAKLFSSIKINGIDVNKNIGFANMTWKHIAALKTDNPEKFHEFMLFLVNSMNFIKHGVNKQKLPDAVMAFDNQYANEQARLLNDAIARVEGLTHHINRLNKELNLYYAEISSNPLFQGDNLLKHTEDFYTTYRDLSMLEAWFDPLADSHDTFMANVAKMYERVKKDFERESDKLLAEYVDKTKGIDVNRLVDQTTAKFIDKINYAEYYKAKEAFFADLEKKPFKKGSKQYIKAVNAWYRNNTVRKTDEEIEALKKKKERSLGNRKTSQLFKDWLNNQYYYNGKTFVESQNGEFFKPNPSVYASSAYKNLTAEEKAGLEYIKELLVKLVERYRVNMIDRGYIPSMSDRQLDATDALKNIAGWHDAHNNKHVFMDENGDNINLLVFPFLAKLDQEKQKDLSTAQTPEELAQLKEENKKIREENDKRHAAQASKDLAAIMPIFIRAATHFNFKHTIHKEMFRILQSFEDVQNIRVAKNGAILSTKKDSKQVTRKKTVRGTKLAERFKQFMEQIFYDNFEKDEGKFTKYSRVVQNYTSLKVMALNPFVAINNTLFGLTMDAVEAVAGDFIRTGDLAKGISTYNLGVTSYFADAGDNVTEFSSKQNAFLHAYPIMMDHTERAIVEAHEGNSTSAYKFISSSLSSMYLLQHSSEHMIQNSMLFANALSHKVKDGKIFSYNEFVKHGLKRTSFQLSSAENDAILEENKVITAERKAEWDKLPSVYDIHEFTKLEASNKGRITIDYSKAGIDVTDATAKQNFDDALTDFQRRVQGLNHRAHGVYNKQDAGVVQRYVLGRLALQFRRWLRPGYLNRWGRGHDWKPEWNERIGKMEQGYYKTMFNLLIRRPFITLTGSKQNTERDNAVVAAEAIANIADSALEYITRAKTYWNSLEDWEKGNVKKALFEISVFFAISALSALALGAWDDEDEMSMAQYWTLHQLDRLMLELGTYRLNPLAFKKDGMYFTGGLMNEYSKIVRSPLAVMTTFDDTMKLISATTGYVLNPDSDTFKSGVYHGDSKIKVRAIKMIPVVNQFYKFYYLEDNYRYFKLY